MFPKGPDSANVGLGICALEGKRHSALYYLREFLSRRFPEHTVLKAVCGGVPAAKTLPTITGDGIVLAGDAAHQVNPLTGGGIVNGMKGGRLAGRVAAEAIRAGDVSNNRLLEYQREWMALMGNAHVRYYRLKEAVNKLSDDAFNRLVAVLRVIPPDDLTLKKVFLTVLKDQPRLLLDVAKVWW